MLNAEKPYSFFAFTLTKRLTLAVITVARIVWDLTEETVIGRFYSSISKSIYITAVQYYANESKIVQNSQNWVSSFKNTNLYG